MPESIKDDKGNAVIESVFVVTICIIIVCALILFGFLFYQQNVLQSVANDTADKIAQTYSYKCKDPDMGYISRDEVVNVNYNFRLSQAFGNVNPVDDKAKWYASSALNRFRLLRRVNNETKITAEIQKSDISSLYGRQCVVTVQESYQPAVIGLLVKNNKVTFEAKSCAVINDYLATCSEVNMLIDNINLALVQSGAEKVATNGSELLKNVSEAIDIITKYLF